MRRNSMIIMAALLLVCAVFAFADEAVLIDFSLLQADIDPVKTGKPTQNRATMMDFSGVTGGASYTEDQKKEMRTSLAIANWDVILSSSSKTNLNQSLSLTAEAIVNQGSADKNLAGKSVMGVRVRFPLESFNSWAKVQPPFEIPAFEPKADIGDDGKITPKQDQGTDHLSRFEGSKADNLTTAYGIVKNVGVIKSIEVTVKGLNFPHGMNVCLIDADGNEQMMFMGYLNFDGWRKLRWENPQYVAEVRNRELRIFPLYPKTVPMVKFGGFVFTRDAANQGGDFVTYVKDVKVLYDKAVLEPVQDIDDESIWKIVSQKENERKAIESKRFGNQQLLRYLESQKKTDIWAEDKQQQPK